MHKLYLLLLTILLASGQAFAQMMEPIQWNIELKAVQEEDVKEVVLTATLEPGWHLYGLDLPEGGPQPTSIVFERLAGVEKIGSITSETPLITKYDEIFQMELSWYDQQTVFRQQFKIKDPNAYNIEGYVRFMGCNDQNCLPPMTEEFRFNKGASTPLTVAPKETSSDSLPVVQTVVPIDEPTITTDLWTPVMDELKAFGVSSTSPSNTGWLWLFITGFLGGLLALLTPCVWPIIPMTVSFFLKRNKSRSKAIREAGLYGISIIVIYLILGLGITLLFGASALNSLSTSAVFNLIFFGLLVLFAVSFLGAFEIVLPASWTNKMDQKADNTTGLLSIFFMAFTLVLVSFSCTGPIIGTLLVQAASMNSIAGPAMGMFGFALALAIPFSLFAIFPNLLQAMPKSGGWLNTVKVVLGFLELALALKFLSVADLAYGWGILDRETFLSIWIVLFALLGVYLLGKIRLPHDGPSEHTSIVKLFMAIASFAFSVYMVPGLWGAPLKAISAFAPPAYTQDFNLYKNEVHAAFTDYESGMAYAKQTGKPVLLDFSGYGCVNCRKMENSVWQDPRVKSILENDYVLITLIVDDKASLPEPIVVEEFGKKRTLRTVGDKWSYLQRHKFGANAQPFYIPLNSDGIPIGPSYTYDENVDNYIRFLRAPL